MKKLLSALVLLLFARCAFAADVRMDDYDVLFAPDAPDAGGLYKVRLTDEIYQNIRRSGEDEIAVFNASGDLVPFFIRVAVDSEKPAKPILQGAGVPVFALPWAKSNSADIVDVTITTGSGGRVVNVRESAGAGAASHSVYKRYLLDLSELFDELPDAVKVSSCALSLDLMDADTLMASIVVYGSDNLKEWLALNEREPLVRLNQGERRIESGRIFIGSPKRYLLLMMEDSGGATLSGAAIDFYEAPSKKPREDTVRFNGSFARNPQMVVYETNGVYPAEKINLKLDSPGFYSVTLYTRGSNDQNWQQLSKMMPFQMIPFRMKTPAEVHENIPISLAYPLERKYWAVSFDVSPPAHPPVLELTRQPREIVFLAQGAHPYVIAVGKKENTPPARTTRGFYNALDEFPESGIRESNIGGPLSRDESGSIADEAGSKAWQRYLVWGVFLIGALLLSWMALSLLRKNKADE